MTAKRKKSNPARRAARRRLRALWVGSVLVDVIDEGALARDDADEAGPRWLTHADPVQWAQDRRWEAERDRRVTHPLAIAWRAFYVALRPTRQLGEVWAESGLVLARELASAGELDQAG
jgi:hypothetical protein